MTEVNVTAPVVEQAALASLRDIAGALLMTPITHVIDDAAAARLRAAGFHLQVEVDPVQFFGQTSGA